MKKTLTIKKRIAAQKTWRDRRKKTGMRMVKFCEKHDIHTAALSRWERLVGTTISKGTYYRIEAALVSEGV